MSAAMDLFRSPRQSVHGLRVRRDFRHAVASGQHHDTTIATTATGTLPWSACHIVVDEYIALSPARRLAGTPFAPPLGGFIT
jgi:hypothetical protein